ncbi:60S ribosomal protein L2 [Mucor velutinosus]|uniref:60S ribosomal protein L2 n=1 Tax=Mucor velutinosus TaxID=708070 RepID=A0AAN7HZR2_9FUNG|nr:60S ribosomal protein L2 [Mucor velutinosus]
MLDEDIQKDVALAIELEEKGQIKEAYFSFTATSQKAIQALNEIKFVHSSIISSPKQYASLLSSIKTCLQHIETIIETHSPATYNPISRQTTGDQKRPPLPPKPSRMQKPAVPPKPKVPSPTVTTTSPSKPPATTTIETELPDNSHQQPEPPIITPRVYESRPTSLPPLPHSHISSLQKSPRPVTEYSSENTKHLSNIRIVAEGEIDPDYLVPAQTNAGDSLAPSSSTMNTDHVPLIPAPPLLTTHRVLQQKVDELEEKIRSCRARKQAIAQGQALDAMTEDSLDQMIAQYLRVLAELKVTLNGVRTTYMSAATIPSILQFQAHVIAYQITLIEAAIFDAIPPQALLEHSSKHPHPRIVASTDFFNYITRCIEHAVLLPQEASSRAQLIHYWIKVASRCFDVNNYQTLKAIISALNTPPVQRLKRTWAYIPKKSTTKLDALNELMSEANNYGQYREHMGMVTTTVVNGKSVQLIRDEHYSRPTVPFLGTFIHDITYLLAAFKSSNNPGNPEEEPRIHEVLNTMHRFQTGPRYTPSLPAAFLKSSQKHHFRPALSSALHRGASRIQRFSGGGFFGGGGSSNESPNSSSSSVANMSMMEEGGEDENLDEQQKMATQYILMRSWVSQNTVDELSTLREPPQVKSNSMYGTRSSSNNGNRTSSVFSNASSNVRFSTGSVSLNTLSTHGDSSMEEEDEKRYSQPPYFPFRKSADGSNNNFARPVTIHEGGSTEGLSREETENFHVASSRTTWNGGPPQPQQSHVPIVPPRPVPKPPTATAATNTASKATTAPTQNDEFRAALAQRLAKVSTEGS